MHCPFCPNEDTQVKDSRSSEDGAVIRRRRVCAECGSRFTTFERIMIRELTVVKKDGRRKLFDRDKLLRSVNIAVRKRPIASEEVERLVSNIVDKFERSGENEITSQQIGQAVMEALEDVDSVAYVRFASVYKDFRTTKDFESFISNFVNKHV